MTEPTAGKYDARILGLSSEYEEKRKSEAARYKASCDALSTRYREDLIGIENLKNAGNPDSQFVGSYTLYKSMSEKLMELYLEFQKHNEELDAELKVRKQALSETYQREKKKTKGQTTLRAFANSKVETIALLPSSKEYLDKCLAIQQKYIDGCKALKKERKDERKALEAKHHKEVDYLSGLNTKGDGNEQLPK